MELPNNVEIIKTYKGKKVSQKYIDTNLEKFTLPNTSDVIARLNTLRESTGENKKAYLFIYENGKITEEPPQGFSVSEAPLD